MTYVHFISFVCLRFSCFACFLLGDRNFAFSIYLLFLQSRDFRLKSMAIPLISSGCTDRVRTSASMIGSASLQLDEATTYNMGILRAFRSRKGIPKFLLLVKTVIIKETAADSVTYLSWNILCETVQIIKGRWGIFSISWSLKPGSSNLNRYSKNPVLTMTWRLRLQLKGRFAFFQYFTI